MRIAAMHGGSGEVRHRVDRRSPMPGLVAATRMPPIAAPVMFVAFSASRRIAFACCSSGVVTVCGIDAVLAGKKNADEAPLTAASTASCQICAWPVSSSTATTAWLAPLARFEATITWWRGSRSAQTPPKSRSRMTGIWRAASTSPRSVVEPVRSSTANASATGAIALPDHRDRAAGEEEAELAVRGAARAGSCGLPVRSQVRLAEAGAQDVPVRRARALGVGSARLGVDRVGAERARCLDAREQDRELRAAAAMRGAGRGHAEPGERALDVERAAARRLVAGPGEEAVPAGQADERREEARCLAGIP